MKIGVPPRDLTSFEGQKWLQAVSKIQARDVSAYRHAGGSGYSSYYVANLISGDFDGTVDASFAADDFYAVPFISPFRISTIDRIGFNVTIGAGSPQFAQVGIYSNKSDKDLYPDKLLLNSANISVETAGVSLDTISFDMAPSTLYWFVFSCGVPQFISICYRDTSTSLLGFNSSLLLRTHLAVTTGTTFGTWPTTFPTNGTAAVDGGPGIIVRFSS